MAAAFSGSCERQLWHGFVEVCRSTQQSVNDSAWYFVWALIVAVKATPVANSQISVPRYLCVDNEKETNLQLQLEFGETVKNTDEI